MAIALELLDLAIAFGLLALILWILAVSGVLAVGGLSHVFWVVALVLFVAWIVLRFFRIGTRRRGGSLSTV